MSKRNSNGTFAAGESGNPAGRPKRTEQEKKIIEEMCLLVPQAVGILKGMLSNNEMPAYLRLRAAEIVLERVAGKPMTSLELDRYEDNQKIEELFGFMLDK